MNNLTFTKPDNRKIAFIVNVYKESPEQVEAAVKSIRAFYTESTILCIFDGVIPSINHIRLLSWWGVQFHMGLGLKRGLLHGAAIWARFFSFGLSFNPDYLIKVDPDTRVLRRLHAWPVPDTMSVTGTVMSAGSGAQHIQGGFQIFTYSAADFLLAISYLDKWKDPLSWRMGQSKVFTDRDMVSTDYLLAAMMNEHNIAFIDHPEMDCRSLPFDTVHPEAAVTHPIKH